MKCDELKAYIGPAPDEKGLADYYLKSEADKVIAHHKYKRCLAMARWCKAEEDAAFLRYNWDSGRYAYVDFYNKWHKICLALAKEPTWERFLQLIHKEAK